MVELAKQILWEAITIAIDFRIIGLTAWSLLLIYVTLIFRDRKWIKNPRWQTEVAREKIRELRQENKKLTEENEQLSTENISMKVVIRQMQNVVGGFFWNVEPKKKKKVS